MKTFKYLAMMLLLTTFALESCNSMGEAKVSSQTVQFDISGMTCEHGCKKAIETKVAKVEGVSKVAIDFETAVADITYDPAKTNPGDIIAVIQGIGGGLYQAKIREGKSPNS
jgi:copper chaperone CopZ